MASSSAFTTSEQKQKQNQKQNQNQDQDQDQEQARAQQGWLSHDSHIELLRYLTKHQTFQPREYAGTWDSSRQWLTIKNIHVTEKVAEAISSDMTEIGTVQDILAKTSRSNTDHSTSLGLYFESCTFAPNSLLRLAQIQSVNRYHFQNYDIPDPMSEEFVNSLNHDVFSCYLPGYFLTKGRHLVKSKNRGN